MLEEWESSGLKRREVCRQRGIALKTFDYWRREHAVKRRDQPRLPRMAAVKVSNAEPAPRFTLSLGNGRRIECSVSFRQGCVAALASG
jgi:hypothetical protein